MKKQESTEQKRRLPATVWVFLLFLAVFLIGSILLPDRDFSPAENRTLAQVPAFSLHALFDRDASWSGAFEESFSDQFPLRDEWVMLKAGSEKLIGKRENNGIYFAADTLIEKPADISDTTALRNIACVNAFARSSGVDTVLALIPNVCCINADLLPRYAFDGGQPALLSTCYANLVGVTPADTTLATLQAHRSEPLYYRTDHHPTSLGAYYIYTSLSQPLGFTKNPLNNFSQQVVSHSFSGTARAKSGAFWVLRDDITLFTDRNAAPCTLTTFEGNEVARVTDGLYELDRLHTADQYTVFLGGNHPRQIIKTKAEGKKLLIVKDSFAHCIAPFLAAHYAEIHLLDLRYYRSSVADYVRENGIDQAIVLYSVSNFSTDKNLLFLGQP